MMFDWSSTSVLLLFLKRHNDEDASHISIGNLVCSGYLWNIMELDVKMQNTKTKK